MLTIQAVEIIANKLHQCCSILLFGICYYFENAWFNQRKILNVALSRRGNQCRKCVFCTLSSPFWCEWTWNEFVIIIMGLHVTRITNKRMLCFMLVVESKTKNGSTSLNCTNNIKRFYNARLHAIFKLYEANDFMSLREHQVKYMQWIAFVYFMWSLLYDGAVCSFLTTHLIVPLYFSMRTHFPSSFLYSFFLFYFMLLSLMLNAIASFIYFLCCLEFSRHLLQLSKQRVGEVKKGGKMP